MSVLIDLPLGGGRMGQCIRNSDWSKSALGSRASWSCALKTTLGFVINSPEPMYLVWGPRELFFYNDAYHSLFPHLAETDLGQPVQSLWGSAWDDVADLVDKALAGTGTRVELHPLSLVREGVVCPTWWTFSLSPVHGDTGQVEGIVCHVQETTGQVLISDRLGANEAFTDRVLASINDCIKVLDLDGKLTFMSEGGQRIMEVSDFNAIKGCPWPDFWQDKGHHEAKAAVQEALAGRHASFMGSARTMAGTLKWWHVQVSPIMGTDGKPEKLLSVSRDMTQLRDAEDALREINESLERTVVERTQDRDRIWRLSADLMLVAQFDGSITAVNPAWQQVLGYPEEALLGQPLVTFVHPQDAMQTLAAVTDLSRGQSILSFKSRYRHANGSYRMISWTAVPDEQFIHAVGRDVQPEEEANETLRLSEEALRQSQKLEAIGQLTGGVAHDFNNLLTVIKSCADLLRPASLPEARRTKYVEAISDTVGRAAKLTNQLLAFARRQSLTPAVFDVAKNVTRVGEMLDALTGSRIKVVIEVSAAQACFINADESQFDTAVVNLVVNARDAMQGVGALTIKVQQVGWLPAVRSHALRTGNYVAVSISDSGCGIPKEELHKIFEPFYTTKGVGKGTGLGLSQVFGFAKQSGGEVMVASEPGNGATFTIYLPQAQAPEDQQKSLEQVVPHHHGLSVLVVEDHEDIGRFTAHTLEDLGYRVHWVPSAEAALSLLASNPARFQMVFSDISMPGMSGIGLYEVVGTLYPELPVILTTGYSQEFTNLPRSDAGRLDLLQKPYSIEALSTLLQDVANRFLERAQPLE